MCSRSRSVVVLAALALVASFSPSDVDAAPPLRVATFSCDATPPIGGHPLIWVTSVKTVEDPLLAKGIVLDDGRTRYVLCALDWCGVCDGTHLLFRSKMAAAAGIDVSQVSLQSVHQHTAPYTDGDAQKLLDKTPNPPRFADLKFLDGLADRLGEAVKGAVARLQPFDRIGTSQAKVDRVASSRRIFVDGKFYGRMSASRDPKLQALPEGNIDPMLKTITLACGDKPLVRLHYYATHPQTFYGDPRASADMPGIARSRLEKKEGVFQIYFTGCSGNVAMGKYNDGKPRARAELADRLYAAMEASAAATRYAPAGSVSWRTVPVVFPLRTDKGHTLAENRARLSDPKASPIARCRAACRVAFAERINRPIDLSMLQIGDVRIVHLPGECVIEYQQFTQQLRPKDFVAVAAYGDVGPGYVCTEKSYTEGGYEPSASGVAPQGEKVLQAAIRELVVGKR